MCLCPQPLHTTFSLSIKRPILLPSFHPFSHIRRPFINCSSAHTNETNRTIRLDTCWPNIDSRHFDVACKTTWGFHSTHYSSCLLLTISSILRIEVVTSVALKTACLISSVGSRIPSTSIFLTPPSDTSGP